MGRVVDAPYSGFLFHYYSNPFLLRLAFREGQQRARGLFREYPLAEIAVCDKRPRFYNHKGGMTAFAFFLWRQAWRGETRLRTALVPASRQEAAGGATVTVHALQP